MNLKKVIVSITSLNTLCLISMNAIAGLTLCSINYPRQINIYCAGSASPSPAPIPPSPGKAACATLFGQQDLPWIAIQATIFGGKSQARCIFKDGNKRIGRAKLTIAPGSLQGKVTRLKTAAGYSVHIAPSVGKFYKEVKATITPNTN